MRLESELSVTLTRVTVVVERLSGFGFGEVLEMEDRSACMAVAISVVLKVECAA